MHLVKWNPWREMDTLTDRMNRFFDGGFLPAHWSGEDSELSGWRPVVDIYDREDKLVIKAELPGVDKKDIHVNVENGVLTLSGERSYENEVKEKSYYRKERSYGRFSRAFTLPEGLDPDKIEAEYKDGILKIEIPKPEEKKPKKISVH